MTLLALANAAVPRKRGQIMFLSDYFQVESREGNRMEDSTDVFNDKQPFVTSVHAARLYTNCSDSLTPLAIRVGKR